MAINELYTRLYDWSENIDDYWRDHWIDIDIDKILNNRITFIKKNRIFIQNQITDRLSENGIYDHVMEIYSIRENVSHDCIECNPIFYVSIYLWKFQDEKMDEYNTVNLCDNFSDKNRPFNAYDYTNAIYPVGHLTINSKHGGEITNTTAINSRIYSIIKDYIGYRFIIPKLEIDTCGKGIKEPEFVLQDIIDIHLKISNNEDLSKFDLYKLIYTNALLTELQYFESVNILHKNQVVEYDLRKGPNVSITTEVESN